ARRSVGPGASVARWLHDQMPATLQGRIRLSSSHLVVLVLLVAGALAVTAWWVVRADDRGTVVAPVSSAERPLVSPTSATSAVTAPQAGAASTTPMVNLNSATQAELEELPGVGPVTAQAILDYRSENGAFTAVDQLLDVSGIGDATLAKIAPYVTL